VHLMTSEMFRKSISEIDCGALTSEPKQTSKHHDSFKARIWNSFKKGSPGYAVHEG
jgi:hypothetical protein